MEIENRSTLAVYIPVKPIPLIYSSRGTKMRNTLETPQ